MTKIKIKKFSEYGLIDKRDFYKKVYDYLLKKKMSFCFTEIGLVSKEDCEKYL